MRYIFNDLDADNVNSLQKAINSLPGIESLKYTPQVLNQEVGANIVKLFEKLRLIPTLFFVDPWGYRGLSLELINSVVKNWGCDCIFFFNYNRINMGLSNNAVREHMNALFGEERADRVREQLSSLAPQERELTVIEAICEALQEMGGKYVLPFRFRHEIQNRISHHLIFVTKHPKGYRIMKEIMAKESSEQQQGVPSFEYNSASIRQPLLFELNRPLDDLEAMLLEEFAGKKISMNEVYEQHNVGRNYISKNYKDVLLKLESEEKITVLATGKTRRKGTFADDLIIVFPPKP